MHSNNLEWRMELSEGIRGSKEIVFSRFPIHENFCIFKVSKYYTSFICSIICIWPPADISRLYIAMAPSVGAAS